jgi:hypothetical protein
VAGNPVTAIDNTGAIQTQSYTGPPPATLEEWHLDMDAGFVNLTFSSAIDTSTLDVSLIRLQNTAGGGSSYDLTSGSTTQSPNGYDVAIKLSETDLNAVKSLADLATNLDVYISMPAETLSDVSGQAIVAVLRGAGQPVATFIPDTTAPEIVSFALNMDSGTIAITFSEVVNMTSTNVLSIEFHNNATNESTSYGLTDGVVSGTDSNEAQLSLSIAITDADLNQIKADLALCTSQQTTFIAIPVSVFVVDMAGNNLVAISRTQGIAASNFVADTTQPTFVAVSVDMDAGTLLMTFSETVLADTVSVTSITLVGTDTTYTLTGGDASRATVTSVLVNMTATDLNAIKVDDALFVNRSTASVAVATGVVQDAVNLDCVAVATGSAVLASSFDADVTSPSLESFDIDLTAMTITLTFSETVRGSTLTSGSATLQSDQASTPQASVTLTQSSTASATNAVSLTLNIAVAEQRTIQLAEALAIGRDSSFLAIGTGFVEDAAGNAVNAIAASSALQATSFTDDTKAPNVTRFSVDMSLGTITLNFDEPMNASSLEVTGLRFQAVPSFTAGDAEYRLTDGTFATVNGLSVTVNMTTTDLNAIKAIAGLVVDNTTTYLTVDAGAVTDMAGNGVNAIASSDALAVAQFVADSVRPSLVSFSIDMDTGVLELTFTETMDTVAGVNTSAIYMQSSSDETTGDVRVALATSTVASSTNSHVVTLNISATDLNEMKRLEIASAANVAYLTMDAVAIADTFGRRVNARVDGVSAVLAATHVPDTTDPSIVAYGLNMDLGVLTLTFSETIRVSTIDVTALQFQNVSNTTAATVPVTQVVQTQSGPQTIIVAFREEYDVYRLTSGSSVTSSNGVVVNITLSTVDQDEFKLRTTLAVSLDTTFLAVDVAAASDMVSNPLVGISNDSALIASEYTTDLSPPTVVSLSLDMNDPVTLEMTFSETVDGSSLNTSALRFASESDLEASNVQIHRLASTTNFTQNLAVTVTVFLSKADVDAIKILDALASNSSTIFVAFDSAALYDTESTAMEATDGIAVGTFVQDAQPPVLDTVTLNMNASTLVLLFSEPVVPSTLDLSAMSVQNTIDGTDESVQLGAAAGVSDQRSLTIEIALTVADANALKELYTLASSLTTSFVSFSNQLIADTSGNQVVAVSASSALQAAVFVPDAVAPTLVSFALNLDTGVLALTFDEPVNGLSLNVADLTLQSSTSSPAETVTLTDGTVSTANSTHVNVTLVVDDLNSLKKRTQLAISQATTFLSMVGGAVVDMNANDVTAIANTAALGASQFIADASSPQLVSFDLDMNALLMTIIFSETMSVSSVNVSEIALQSASVAGAGTTQVTLTDSSVVTVDDNTTIVVSLSDADADALQLDDNLAVSSQTTFMTISSEGALDTAGNLITAVDSSNALAVTTFTDDTTAPSLVSCAVNMTSGVVSLVFDEIVRSSSVNTTLFTLLNSTTTPVSSSVGLSGTVLDGGNGREVTVQLLDDILDAVKLEAGIASAQSNSVCAVGADSVSDMVANVVTVQEVVAASEFVADAIAPELVSFDFDMPTSTPPLVLTLTFSEAIDINTFDATGLTLNSNGTSTPTESFTLTGLSSVVSSNLGRVVTGEVTFVDYIGIRDSNELVGRRSSQTVLSMGAATVDDMAGNSVAIVGASDNVTPTSYTADLVRPYIRAFDLDMDSGIAVVVLSEAVVEDSLQASGLFVTASQASSAANITLVPSNATFTSNTTFELAFEIELLNALKLDFTVAVSEGTTLLGTPFGLVTDPANNTAVAAVDGDVVAVRTFVADTTAPRLVAFDLDMNNGTLTMTFDEPVQGTTLDGSTAKLQSTAQFLSPGSAVSLGSFASISSINSTVVQAVLTLNDANSVRALPDLATTTANTYLTITDGFVEDMASNPSLTQVPVAVGSLSTDVTATSADTFSIHFGNSYLNITFVEPINATSLNTSALVVATAATGGLSLALEPVSVQSDEYSTLLQVKIQPSDLDEMKRVGICSSLESCVLIVPENALYDAGGVVVPGFTLNATDIVEDAISPSIISRGFTKFDLNTGRLTIKMDESVNVSSVDMTKVTLRSFFEGTTADLTLTGGIVNTTENSDTLVLDMSFDDLLVLQGDDDICFTKSACYVSLGAAFVLDTTGNPSTATSDGDPFLGVQVFVADTTPASVTEFALDLDAKTIELTFSEAVDAETLQTTAIQLQSTANASASEAAYHALTGGAVSGLSLNSIRVTMLTADVQRIKAQGFAVNISTTFMSVAEGLVLDRAIGRNPSAAVSVEAGLQAANYSADTIAPRLSRFSFNLGEQTLTLSFNEPVYPATVNFSAITMQDNSTSATASVTLTGGVATLIPAVDGDVASQVFSILLNAADLTSIKTKAVLGTSQDNTFLSLAVASIEDVSGNGAAAIASTAAIQAQAVVQDDSFPELVQWSLSLEALTITLTFNDVMDASTLDVTGLAVQAAAQSVQAIALTTSNSSSSDGATVTINLSDEDAFAVLSNDAIGTSKSTSYLVMAATVIDDIDGVDVVAITNGKAQQASEFTDDTTRPEVSNVAFNAGTGTLVIDFSEFVDADTFVAENITLVADRDVAAASLQLAPATTVSWNSLQTVATLVLEEEDLFTLQLDDGFAVNDSTLFAAFEADMVADFAANLVIPATIVNATAMGTFVADTVAPTVASFVLDIDVGVLRVTFSEIMRADTINVTAVVLQYQADASNATSAEEYRLTDGSVIGENGLNFTLRLIPDDLTAIKQRGDLASALDSSYLRVESTFAQDMAGNAVTAREVNDGLQATTFINDASQPTLVSVQLSMDTGALIMSFSESVDDTTLQVSQLTIQSSGDGTGASHTLTGGDIGLVQHDIIEVNLTTSDMNAIKALPTLATSTANSFVSFPTTAVQDMAGNNVTAVATSAAVQVASFEADATAPTLVSFTFNLNNGTVSMTFDETVNVSSLSTGSMALAASTSATIGSTNYFAISGGLVASETYSTVATFVLPDDDLHAIKLLTSLGTADSNTRLTVNSTLVVDMADVAVTAVDIANSIVPTSFVADTTAPQLVNATLDFSTNTATLEFDEPVLASSVNVTLVGYVASANGVGTVLTGVSHVSSGNGLIMTIQIDNADLDGFQVEPTLCTDVSNCFVTLASTAVTDMSGNDVTGVLASSPGTVGSVVADTIPPELVAFDANLGNGTLTLTFSEIVNVSTVSPEALTLLNNFTASLATSSFQLTGGRVSGKDGAAYTRVVTVGLLVVDMYEIQQVLDLAVSVNTTFVATSTQLVDDMAGNAVVAISAAGTVLQVTRFAADTVAPSLVSFTLNVDTAQLSITFDEAILASSFNVSGIVLQAANAVPAGAGTDVRLRLNETSTVSNINAPVINVTLTTDDLDLIKLGSAFCISTSTCFISLDRTTATDANTQPVEVASGVVASSVVADSTSPSVVSVALDMDTNTLEFVFDEPVNATSLSATSIALQSATNSPSASYTLTGSDSSSANNGRVVSVVMTTGDVNAVKALSGLVRDQATSNVAVSSSMIADMAGNNVVAIAVTSAVGVSSFTADTTSPTLVEFSADMTLGLLKMTFDETVDSSSFVTTSVQLRESAEAVAATYNLTGGTVPSQLSTVVTLLFTRSDLNIIKADTELFTNGQTAFVSIASGIINDVFGNLVNEVNVISAI